MLDCAVRCGTAKKWNTFLNLSGPTPSWWSLVLNLRAPKKALRVSRATKLTNTPHNANARHELVRKHLAGPIYSLHMRWEHVGSALYALSVPAFFKKNSYLKPQSHIVDARLTHWKLSIFCQSVVRASVVRQHSLLVRGGCCTNATHIFVQSPKEVWCV